jgi:hypothetical protein
VKIQLGDMLDISGAEEVQVQIRHDARLIWVNVDGSCILRICKIKNFELADDRVADFPAVTA